MTTRREPEEIDDDPRDLEEREEYQAVLRAEAELPPQPVASKPGLAGAVQRFGLAPLLGGAAALIALAFALAGSFSDRPTSVPEARSQESTLGISGDWHGTPSGEGQPPLLFHLVVAEAAMTPGAAGRTGSLIGTVQNPCQPQSRLTIDSGRWDGSRLTLHVAGAKPLSLEATPAGDGFDGTITQSTYTGHITLERGTATCPGH